MAKDLNKVMIIGRLGKDCELRYTPQGAAVCSFSVASGRSYKTSAGEQHDETEWFNVVAWNKLGEICNQYLAKGSQVYIEGRIKTEKWQDKESGQDRYRTTVVAQDMIILSGNNQGAYSADENAEDVEPEAPAPAPQARPQAAPARNTPQAPASAPRVPQNGTQRTPARPSSASASAYTRANNRNVPQTIDNDEDLPF